MDVIVINDDNKIITNNNKMDVIITQDVYNFSFDNKKLVVLYFFGPPEELSPQHYHL